MNDPVERSLYIIATGGDSPRMTIQPKRRDLSATYRVVMAMLESGEARPHELAVAGNVSQQIISLWISSAALDWQERRAKAVATRFAKRMLNEPRSKIRVSRRKPKS